MSDTLACGHTPEQHKQIEADLRAIEADGWLTIKTTVDNGDVHGFIIEPHMTLYAMMGYTGLPAELAIAALVAEKKASRLEGDSDISLTQV